MKSIKKFLDGSESVDLVESERKAWYAAMKKRCSTEIEVLEKEIEVLEKRANRTFSKFSEIGKCTDPQKLAPMLENTDMAVDLLEIEYCIRRKKERAKEYKEIYFDLFDEPWGA